MKRCSVTFMFMAASLVAGLTGCSKSDQDNSESQPSATTGQPGVIADLARRLPNQTLGFIATSGADQLKTSFDQSTLAKIWRDPQVRDFYQKVEQELMRLLQRQAGPDEVEIVNLIRSSVALSWQRPMIIGLVEKKAASRREPPLYGVAILDAGPRKKEFEAAIQQIEAKAPKDEIVKKSFGAHTMHTPRDTDDVMVYWGWVDNFLVFALNDKEGLALQNLKAPKAGDVPAVNALAKVHSGIDVLALHVDVVKLIQMIKSSMTDHGDAEDIKMIETVLASLGLDKVRTATGRIGFSGPDMLAEAWLEVPQPFTGLLNCLKPANMQQFDLVEKRAFNANIINADLAGVYDTVMQTIQKTAPSPQVYQDWQQEVTEFEQEIGVKIRDGLLASLAGPAVVYSLPPDMNTTSGAFAMMWELKDAALMARSLGALEQFVSLQMDQEMGIKGMLQIDTVPLQDKALHVWTIPFLSVVQITPCWMIVDNQLVIASNPAVARTALAHLTNPNRGANSIRRKPTFQQVAQNPPPSLLSFGYIESGVLLRQILSIGQRVWPLLAMGAKNIELNLPALLPTLDEIIAEMGPSSDVLWTESDGLYLKSRGPISGGAIGMGVGVLGVGAAFVLPYAIFQSESSQHQQLSTRAQMAQIEMALEMFMIDCGRYPTEEEGLNALRLQPTDLKGWNGPYIKENEMLNPWGNPYIYKFPGTQNKSGFDLISYGRDGQPGGNGPDMDIGN
jgi:general secretion pathway protein G